MIKADKYYIENLNQILVEMNTDIDPRPKYKDGTPAHCFFIAQVFEKYDLSRGEFPITTLRNTAVKTGIREMLTIYQEQTNTKEGFHKNGVKWWDEWMNEGGNIGRAYSYNIESHRPNEMKKTVVKVKPRLVDEKYSVISDIDKIEIQESIDGVVYSSDYRCYGDYIIISSSKKDKGDGVREYIKCQFLDYGYITEIRKDSLKKGQHPKNNFARTNLGIGYLDYYNEVKGFTKEEVDILKSKWDSMLKRCYSKNQDKVYNKCFVHNRWHSFKNFLIDIRFIPQYHLAKEEMFNNWELDKDYYGSNCYSNNTCTFLNKKENVLYRNSQIKPIKITDNGKVFYELSYTSLAETLNLSKTHVKRIVDNNSHKTIDFEFINDNENLYRYELSRNQVNELIKGLRDNPYGRRNIISFWNWSNIDKKELVECAFETLWTVRKSGDTMYLDMTLTQRSQDAIMATYINKTQYVALQMMVACHLGFEVGTFAHFVQNYHIYDRHIDACNELLTREPLDFQPTMKLNVPKGTNFYDIRLEDFEIVTSKEIKKIESELEIAV